MNDIDRAHLLAREHLSDAQPIRWQHVQAVAGRANKCRDALPVGDSDALVAAAWLHDIGYGSSLATTGFHPLDGARFLRSERFDDRVARLVAHHTAALAEAELRGLAETLSDEFEREVSPCADLLWYCDLTTGPRGELVTVIDRIAEIEERYGPDAVVTRFIEHARDELVTTCERAERTLAEAGVDL